MEAIIERSYTETRVVERYSATLDPKRGIAKCHGRFIGNEAVESHRLWNQMICAYLDNHESLKVVLSYESFDPKNLACIFKIFKRLNHALDNGKRINVLWRYDLNDEMLDVGLDFLPFCEFKFDITYKAS